MAKRQYNKKKKEALKEEVKAVNAAPCIPLDVIQQVTDQHIRETQGRINYHLQKVLENTGEVLPEDTSYMMSLSSRELSFKLKNLTDNVL